MKDFRYIAGAIALGLMVWVGSSVRGMGQDLASLHPRIDHVEEMVQKGTADRITRSEVTASLKELHEQIMALREKVAVLLDDVGELEQGK